MLRHDLPDYEYIKGYSEIINGLYVAGEDDVDILLYGEEEARNINRNFSFEDKPAPMIDVWIDLRDIRDSNRQVFVPSTVQKLDFPFKDGDVESAKIVIPQALVQLAQCMSEQKRVLISCHEGKSRSCLLTLLYLQTLMSNVEAELLLRQKRPVAQIDKRFRKWLSEAC